MANISASVCDGMYVFYTATSGGTLPVVTSGATIQQVADSAKAAGVGVARLTNLTSGGSMYMANTANTADNIPAGSFVRAMSLVKLGCSSSMDIGYDYTVLSGGEIKAVPANGTVTLIDVVSE